MQWQHEREQEQEEEATPPAEKITVGQYADEYLARMESGALLTKSGRPFKLSSISTARGQLRHFKDDGFADRRLASVTRHEAIRWAEKHERKQSALQSVNTLFALAVDEELLDKNPFRGLMRKPEGRKNERPPSEEEMLLLVASCDALGDYGPRMEATLTFAAYMIMRPGELFALTWDDIDLDAGEVHVSKRLYRGRTDLPKSNEARTVALTPPARRALLTLPQRHGYVFRNKSGGQLTAPTLTAYWSNVISRAGLDFDFYLATKHYGVWYMKTQLGLSNADIAAQAGWSESSVERMVATYAHSNIGALDRIKAAWTDAQTVTQTEKAAV